MADVLVRPATIDDAETIAEFNRAMARETEQIELDAGTVSRGVRKVFDVPTHGVYYVAERDGKIVGQLQITYEYTDWRDGVFWWIQSVYVVPEARKQGVYRALQDHVRQAARRDPHVRGLRLYVYNQNLAAKAVYKRLGFRKTEYDLYETDPAESREPGQTATAPREPLDRDLYCLKCGYNLRGLAGDPVRCPECGNLNPMGDALPPAQVITAKLREMENAPVLCIAAILTSAVFQTLFWYVWSFGARGMAHDVFFVLGLFAFGPLAAWLGGVLRFRWSCMRKHGWFGALVQYHLCGLSACLLIFTVMGTATWLLWSVGHLRWSTSYLVYLATLAALFALLIAGVRYVVRPIYRGLRETLDRLQREVAITVARDERRRRMAHGIRRPFG